MRIHSPGLESWTILCLAPGPGSSTTGGEPILLTYLLLIAPALAAKASLKHQIWNHTGIPSLQIYVNTLSLNLLGYKYRGIGN